ncbi:MAG: hypothetical protein JWO85_522 [Candidatus Eremiobacteraeota bacterium]|nr:hypothetical protein [Candidatus Eremiobacteraeota bacterium]
MRHNSATIPAKRTPRGKSEMGRPHSPQGALQLSLMDKQIEEQILDGDIRDTVAKKHVSMTLGIALRDAAKIVADEQLNALMEEAVAKNRDSIEASVKLHKALIEHMRRMRDFNGTVAA